MSANAAYLHRLVCLLRGHRRVWTHWISGPQPLCVNCEGDDWFIARVCERCGKWLSFEAGRDFIHTRGWEPIIAAAARLKA